MCAPLVARKTSKRHSSSCQLFFNMSSVSVHTSVYIIVFISTSVIGVAKNVQLDAIPKAKIRRINIWRARKLGC